MVAAHKFISSLALHKPCEMLEGTKEYPATVASLQPVCACADGFASLVGRRAEQLQRVQAAFRAALAGDLAALKAAIQQYKEQVARLQCQKQLLLSQARPECDLM